MPPPIEDGHPSANNIQNNRESYLSTPLTPISIIRPKPLKENPNPRNAITKFSSRTKLQHLVATVMQDSLPQEQISVVADLIWAASSDLTVLLQTLHGLEPFRIPFEVVAHYICEILEIQDSLLHRSYV